MFIIIITFEKRTHKIKHNENLMKLLESLW